MHRSSFTIQRAKGSRSTQRLTSKAAPRAPQSSAQGPWHRRSQTHPQHKSREGPSCQGRSRGIQPDKEGSRGERNLRDSLKPSWSKKLVSSLACTTSFHAVPLPLPHPPRPVFHSRSQIMSFPLGEGGSNAPPTSISALSLPTFPPTTFLTGPQACLA